MLGNLRGDVSRRLGLHCTRIVKRTKIDEYQINVEYNECICVNVTGQFYGIFIKLEQISSCVRRRGK